MAIQRWTISNFESSSAVELCEAKAATETIILSLVINNSDVAEAHILIEAKDALANILFKFYLDIPAESPPYIQDSLMILEPGDKIFVTSNQQNVSVLLTGDES